MTSKKSGGKMMRLFISTLLSLLPILCFAEQTYPNIKGETLLEDDRVVVQRFVLLPGQWEGIHEHPQHQLVIVLKDTDELIYRFRGAEKVFSSTDEVESGEMSAFWRPGPVVMEDQHESGNTGTRTLEWIAITFKKESIATDKQPAQFVNVE